MHAPHPLLSGIAAHTVQTARQRTFFLEAGDATGEVVIFVHGNVSASRFFEETLLALPAGYRGIAVDLRGYGRSEPLAIDATRGVRDFSDDVLALMDALGIASAHVVGWSVGGGVGMQLAIDQPARLRSLTLLATMSPYGFAGSHGPEGTPCTDDHAGSGGGTANPDFVRLLAAGDRSADQPMSPRNVMNGFYFRPPFRVDPAREEVFVSELLTTRTGADHYPGDVSPSPHWPTVAPGPRGMNNAISSQYCNLSAFAAISPQPPVLWVRGADDQIVSDTSLFDVGYLGSLGAIPGWPGPEAYPPQPMIGQIQHLLHAYAARGGQVQTAVLDGCGHSPHIEQPDAFRQLLHTFLQAHRA